MCMYIYIYICTRNITYVCIYIYIYICIYTHTYTHRKRERDASVIGHRAHLHDPPACIPAHRAQLRIRSMSGRAACAPSLPTEIIPTKIC